MDIMEQMQDIQGRCKSEQEASLRLSAQKIVKTLDKEGLDIIMRGMADAIASAEHFNIAVEGLAIMLDEMRLRSYVD